eukprot:TRINITY_DN11744_c0_g1_i1.p1 TRINITY_DN11744_c0_g1~~TRINITY_DN11744_c0_g1_i1.p1  ORF type:complete len:614 (+),score=125.67 TRINITY_DN11744_c0_g1_i1:98-1939(+)
MASADEEEAFHSELTEWMAKLRLSQYLEGAKAWCEQNGAAELTEVKENWEQLSDHLQLKNLEKKRMAKDIEGGASASNAATPKSQAVGGGYSGTSRPAAAPAPVPAKAATGQPPYTGASPAMSSAPPARRGKEKAFGPKEDPQRYVMLEQLGHGTTATVHKCMRGAEVFAVKTVDLSKLNMHRDFQKQLSSLRREVQILFSLRHPRIVSLFDVIEEERCLRLVLEFVQGGELFDHIANAGSFSEPVARYIFVQIVEGLSYIHSQDIVHRDLKPENILVDTKASRHCLLEVKLSDFGHSKFINDGFTVAITRCGTPQYWAPEVSDPVKAARGYDQRVDLWSLGVALYVMLMGAYPFHGTDGEIEDQLKRAQFSFGNKPLSDPAKDLVRSLIKVKPGDRLSLQQCLQHAWIGQVREGDPSASSQLQRLSSVLNPQLRQERIQLPILPSKDQVDALKRDLQMWNSKFKSSAILKHQEVIVKYGDLTAQLLEEAHSELQAIISFYMKALPNLDQQIGAAFHGFDAPPPSPSAPEQGLISCQLRVSPAHGAGLTLKPTDGGMLVLEVSGTPGQPQLQKDDLIVAIGGVQLQGNHNQINEIFGANFADRVPLEVLRGQA